MAGRPKQSALDAFNDNLEDAHLLVSLAEALTNTRQRRMRKEKREAIGAALKVNRREREQLDCVESRDFFVVVKPDSAIRRSDLDDVRPLLRQALVAGSAAVETYVADRVMELVGPVLRREPDDMPANLKAVTLSVGDYYTITDYQRPGWGLRRVIKGHVEDLASLAPGQIGKTFTLVGQDKLMSKVDRRRKLQIGTSTERLDRIYERRNRIAHTADRDGRGRASLEVEEVRSDLQELEEVVDTIEAVTAA